MTDPQEMTFEEMYAAGHFDMLPTQDKRSDIEWKVDAIQGVFFRAVLSVVDPEQYKKTRELVDELKEEEARLAARIMSEHIKQGVAWSIKPNGKLTQADDFHPTDLVTTTALTEYNIEFETRLTAENALDKMSRAKDAACMALVIEYPKLLSNEWVSYDIRRYSNHLHNKLHGFKFTPNLKQPALRETNSLEIAKVFVESGEYYLTHTADGGEQTARYILTRRDAVPPIYMSE